MKTSMNYLKQRIDTLTEKIKEENPSCYDVYISQGIMRCAGSDVFNIEATLGLWGEPVKIFKAKHLASAWDAFKERWFPTSLKKKYPPIYQAYEIRYSFIYPDIPPYQAGQPHIREIVYMPKDEYNDYAGEIELHITHLRVYNLHGVVDVTCGIITDLNLEEVLLRTVQEHMYRLQDKASEGTENTGYIIKFPSTWVDWIKHELNKKQAFIEFNADYDINLVKLDKEPSIKAYRAALDIIFEARRGRGYYWQPLANCGEFVKACAIPRG